MRIHIFFVFLLFFIGNKALPIPFFSDYKANKAYKEKNYKKVIQILEKEQVERSSDARLNYNIANAYYKLGKFKDAGSNYQRAVQNSAVQQVALKEKSYFNWGNSFYKNGLTVLPDGWEKQGIDKKKLDFAIDQLTSSIEKFENVLVLHKDNKKAESNLKEAKELLKKLEEKKKKQQEQQQKQDKKDKEEQKDQQKDQEDKSKKQEEKDEESSDRKEKDEAKDGDKKQDEKKDGSDKRDEKGDQRKDDKLDEKQDGKKKDDVDDKAHDQPSDKKDENQQSEPESTDTQKENQESVTKALESEGEPDHKKRRMGAILDNLQAEEAKTQKKIIMQKSKGTRRGLGKNW